MVVQFRRYVVLALVGIGSIKALLARLARTSPEDPVGRVQLAAI